MVPTVAIAEFPRDFKSVGRKSRIAVKSTEGDFAGAYGQRCWAPSYEALRP
jgi:hypothetical protein